METQLIKPKRKYNLTPEGRAAIVASGRIGGLMNSTYGDHVIKITEDYIKELDNDEKLIPTLTRLCIKLDISEDTLHKWKKKHDAFAELTKKVKLRQLDYLIRRSTDRYNPAGAIFLMKAMHGLIETSRTELTGKEGMPISIVGGMLHTKEKLPKNNSENISHPMEKPTYNKQLEAKSSQ